MNNATIILMESVKLMEAGVIKGSGIKGTTPDGKQIELPEQIHTYQAWKSLGYQVKKGAKAVAQFPIWKHTSKQLDEVDEEGNPKEKSNMFMKVSAFFTKDQVEKLDAKQEVNRKRAVVEEMVAGLARVEVK